MSIQSEINRIAGAKSDIADAIEDQGVTVPSGTKLDGMANLIGQISGGSGKLNSTQAADAYDPTATYAVGDKVSYAGNVYSCISAISTPEAWDSTHWDQVDPIQDQVDDLRNTLSHKADAIYDAASGDIASFPDGADGLPVKDLTVGIEPVQAGTGDPSPDNVRPISGWTRANVSRTGKNLLERWRTNDNTTNGITYTVNNDAEKSFTIDGTATANSYCGYSYVNANNAMSAIPFRGMAMTGHVECSDSNVSAVWSYFKEDGSYEALASGTTKQATFTVPDEAVGFRILFAVPNGSTVNNAKACLQLELGSVATAFEPCTVTTIPISWQSEAGTVYGGTVDPVTGKLTKTLGNIDLGTLDWTYDSTNMRFLAPHGNIVKESNRNTFIICPIYEGIWHGEAYDQNWNNVIYVGGVNLVVHNHAYTDATAFKTAMDGVQVVFEMSYYPKYTLTAQQLTTLLGQNNIWADTGDSTVEYPADTKLYIDKKLAALVAALS